MTGKDFAGTSLPRSSPEKQGVDSAGIIAFLEETERTVNHLHSLMIVRHGAVVAEGWWKPYGPEYPHVLFSLSKSFTSTAVGFAVAERLLSLDETVVSFFSNEIPTNLSEIASANLGAMHIRHLLSMSTGHAQDTLGALFRTKSGRWIDGFLESAVEFAPGTHFVYNTGATYMLSVILQRITGLRVLDYLTPRLFEPLGIEAPIWEVCPDGYNVGGWGLSIRTEDIAKFGQLYLQRGAWNGSQLLPSGWAEEATRIHISNGVDPENDWAQGYGFQFWRCKNGGYRGDGAFGQYCVVLPEQDAVVAITSGLGDMQSVLNLVWKHLLPAIKMNNTAPNNAVEKDKTRDLLDLLATLSMPKLAGTDTPMLTDETYGGTYDFPFNDHRITSVTLEFNCNGSGETNESFLAISDHAGDHQIEFTTDGEWKIGLTTFRSTVDQLSGTRKDSTSKVGVVAAWISPDTFALRVVYYLTPFCADIVLKFSETGNANIGVGTRMEFSYRENVGFGEPVSVQLVGSLKS